MRPQHGNESDDGERYEVVSHGEPFGCKALRGVGCSSRAEGRSGWVDGDERRKVKTPYYSAPCIREGHRAAFPTFNNQLNIRQLRLRKATCGEGRGEEGQRRGRSEGMQRGAQRRERRAFRRAESEIACAVS